MSKESIVGAKAGEGDQRQPYIAPDSARSVTRLQQVIGLSEGEIKGFAVKDIKLDGTPLSALSTSIQCDYRFGSSNQTSIDGVDEVANEIGVGVELRSDREWLKSITSSNLDALGLRLRWSPLVTNFENGDRTGVRIAYKVYIAPANGSYSLVLDGLIDDKTADSYERYHEFKLPPSDNGWTIRVVRETPNSESSLVTDKMYVQAYSEIIKSKFNYPFTSLISLEYDAQTFPNIAKVSVEAEGMIIKVPTNYDPVTRKYSGIWNGLFKLAYTNNPAWVYYDLVTNPRYGLGDKIKASMVDKWALYKLAMYCDQFISDGYGALEPRFTCNVYLQSKERAYDILNRLTGLFRAINFWSGTEIVVDADIPQDTSYLYTNANVVDGLFEYAGTPATERYSVVKVAWDNPLNAYSTEYEAVSYEHLIKELGFRVLELDAWGCTSRGQALRAGRWALLAETDTITFKVGMDGYLALPGKIIEVQDEFYAGKSNGGRIKYIDDTRKIITVDRDVSTIVGDTLSINSNSGEVLKYNIASSSGKVITLLNALSDDIDILSIWVINSSLLVTQKYRVMTVKYDDVGEFTISATAYNPNKYEEIDNNIIFDKPPTSITNPVAQDSVTDVQIESTNIVYQGLNNVNLTIKWVRALNAVEYIVEFKKDNGSWFKLPTTGNSSVTIENVYAGKYIARVTAVSAFGLTSLQSYSFATIIAGKLIPPSQPLNFRTSPSLFAINVLWDFPINSKDVAFTRIQSSLSDPATLANFDNVIEMDRAYPEKKLTVDNMKHGELRWFRAKLVDKLGFDSAYTSWVVGESNDNPSAVIDLISGHITAGTLDKVLTDKIQVGVDAKAVADIAKTAAATAQTQANLAVTNAATAQTQANLGVTNAAAAQAKANAASTAAAAAQTQANLGVSNAAIAKTAADNAQAQANAGVTNAAAAKVVADKAAADLITKTNAINADIAGVVSTMNNGFTSVRTDFAAADAVVTGKIDAYKVSNDAALATVATKAESAVTANSATAANVTALTTRVTTAEGKIATKAENSALTALDSKVTTVDGKVTSQGTAITALTGRVTTAEGTLSTKADSSALTALDSKVTQQGGTVSSQGTAITKLQNDLATTNTTVATKASSAAVTSLDNRVVSIDGKVTTNASAITALNGKMTTVENGLSTKAESSALNNYYTKTDADTATAGKINEYKAALSIGGVNQLKNSEAERTSQAASNKEYLLYELSPQLKAFYNDNLNKDITISFDLKVAVAGAVQVYCSNGTFHTFSASINVAAADVDTWVRYKVTTQPRLHPTNTASLNSGLEFYGVYGTGRIPYLRKVQLEAGNVATDWSVSPRDTQAELIANATAIQTTNTEVSRVNGVVVAQGTQLTNLTATVAGKADASALASLTTRVTTEEGKSTSQGTAITSLQNSVTGLTGVVNTKATSAAVTALDNKVVAIDGRVTTNATAITTLNGKMTTVENGLATKLDASVISEYYTKTQADTATTGKIDEFKANLIIGVRNYAHAIQKGETFATYSGSVVTVTPNQGKELLPLTNPLNAPFKLKITGGTSVILTTPSVSLKLGVEGILSFKIKNIGTNNAIFNFNGLESATYVKGSRIVLPNEEKEIVVTGKMRTIYDWIQFQFWNPTEVSGGVYTDVTVLIADIMFTEGTAQVGWVEPASITTAALAANATAINTTNTEVSRVNGVVISQGTALTKLTGDLATTNGTLATKADGAALTALTNRVTSAEGVNTTQSSSITTLTNNLATTNTNVATKAATTAVTALDSKVTGIDGRVTANTSNITSLSGRVTTTENGLATKADTSAVTALTTRVGTVEGGLSTQASDITSLKSSIAGTAESITANGSQATLDTIRLPTTNALLSDNTDSMTGSLIKLKGQVHAPVTNSKMLIDSTKLYKLRMRYRRTSGATNYIYIAVINYNATGDRTVTVSNVLNAVGTPINSAIYPISSELPALNLWREVEYYFKGKSTGASTGSGTRASPRTFPALAATVDIGVLANYYKGNDLTQEYEIDYLIFEDATNEAANNANAAAISTTNTEVSRVNGVVVSQGTQLTNLNATLTTLSGTVNTKADAAALTSLTTRVTNAEGVNGTQSGQITTLTGNISTINGSLATKAENSALTALDSKVTAIDGRVTSQNSSITTLNSSLATTNTNVTAAQNAANAANTLAGGKGKVLYQTATPTGADQDAKNLWIDIAANANTPKRWNGTAWVAVSDKAATDALAAANAATAALTNKADASAVTSLTTRVSNAEGVNTSQATALTNLSTTVGGHTTTISNQTTTINGVKGVHAFKIDNNGVISGYGLISELVNGTVKSQFGVNANTFFIGAPANNKKPFIVLTAPGTINGVTVPAGTYIDTAFIGDATITKAKIANLAVDSAKIADAAITSAKIGDAQITTAKIGDLQVGTAKIANAAITTAKIGDLQVDTLKIKDDAVTVSVAAQNVSSLSIVTTGGKVRVNLGLSYYYAVNGGDASNRLVIRVYRNNALIRTYSLRPTAVAITSVGSEGGGATIASAFFSFTQELPMIVDAVPAGTYTYSVTLSDPRYNGMYESAYLMESIALMEVKK